MRRFFSINAALINTARSVFFNSQKTAKLTKSVLAAFKSVSNKRRYLRFFLLIKTTIESDKTAKLIGSDTETLEIPAVADA
jgi:hypothetical protein